MSNYDRAQIRPTRIAGLGYAKHPKGWTFADTETANMVGEVYRTKTELLSDVDGYARRGGWAK